MSIPKEIKICGEDHPFNNVTVGDFYEVVGRYQGSGVFIVNDNGNKEACTPSLYDGVQLIIKE